MTGDKTNRPIPHSQDISIMTKLRLGLQLKEAIRGSESTNKNQYLTDLTNKFDEYRENLRKLNEALKAQSLASKQLTQTRIRVRPKYVTSSFLSTDSPFNHLVNTFTGGGRIRQVSRSVTHHGTRGKFTCRRNEKCRSSHGRCGSKTFIPEYSQSCQLSSDWYEVLFFPEKKNEYRLLIPFTSFLLLDSMILL
jgi:hypothetical protein